MNLRLLFASPHGSHLNVNELGFEARVEERY